MITKLLSTVKMVRFEDADGKVIGRIERDKLGICKLIGERPTHGHYEVVVYQNPLRKDDRGWVSAYTPRADLVS